MQAKQNLDYKKIIELTWFITKTRNYLLLRTINYIGAFIPNHAVLFSCKTDVRVFMINFNHL